MQSKARTHHGAPKIAFVDGQQCRRPPLVSPRLSAPRGHSATDCHILNPVSVPVSQRSAALKHGALGRALAPHAQAARLPTRRLGSRVDFRHCRLADRLIVRISRHWLVGRTALVEPMPLGPEASSIEEGKKKRLKMYLTSGLAVTTFCVPRAGSPCCSISSRI